MQCRVPSRQGRMGGLGFCSARAVAKKRPRLTYLHKRPAFSNPSPSQSGPNTRNNLTSIQRSNPRTISTMFRSVDTDTPSQVLLPGQLSGKHLIKVTNLRYGAASCPPTSSAIRARIMGRKPVEGEMRWTDHNQGPLPQAMPPRPPIIVQ